MLNGKEQRKHFWNGNLLKGTHQAFLKKIVLFYIIHPLM